MIKRIFALLACVVAVFMLCSVVCYAEEAAETTAATEATTQPTETTAATEATTQLTETTAATEATITPPYDNTDEPGEKNYTLFGRLWEYVTKNKEAILGVVGDVALFALAFFVKIKNDGKTGTLLNKISAVETDVSGTASSQKSVTSVINNMIDGYNALTNTYEKYGETEDDRSRVNGAILVTNTAILDILTTVYANSKNLPQGVKDLVNLKYANCLKSLEDDEMLKAIVTMVRNSIGTDIDVSAAEENSKNTED